MIYGTVRINNLSRRKSTNGPQHQHKANLMTSGHNRLPRKHQQLTSGHPNPSKRNQRQLTRGPRQQPNSPSQQLTLGDLHLTSNKRTNFSTKMRRKTRQMIPVPTQPLKNLQLTNGLLQTRANPPLMHGDLPVKANQHKVLTKTSGPMLRRRNLHQLINGHSPRNLNRHQSTSGHNPHR